MSKICTTIEQSQKLIELGIDVNTADMHYVRKITDFMGNKLETPKWSMPKYGNTNSKHASYIIQNFENYELCPVWSLAALLELIGKNISNVSLKYDGSEWFIIYEGREEYEYKSFVSTCPLDAAFKMICILLENKEL